MIMKEAIEFCDNSLHDFTYNRCEADRPIVQWVGLVALYIKRRNV